MMVRKAKASITAVKSFGQVASSARDYSPKFDRGIQCFDSLIMQLTELVNALRDSLDNMSVANEKLDVKIRNIEEILAKLTAQLNSLEEKLSELESELASIPATITVTTVSGEGDEATVEEHEISNPAYDAVCARISAVEGEIASLREEMYPHEVRLEHANSVSSRLASHIDVINAVIYSLEEKKSICSQLRIELDDQKVANLNQGSIAAEKLKSLVDIISEYLRAKMVYDNITPTGSGGVDKPGINVTVNINRTTIVQEQTIIQQPDLRIPIVSKEEIEKHHIKFDTVGRISSYDEKTFGGKYNTYKDRLDRTSADGNPVLGRYEGARGESKFIPSNRSAEGIAVIEILDHYGLDGIVYRNAEPDFEVCAEAVVTISDMTENRDNYSRSDGEMELGNFSQADIELAKAWNLGNRDGRNDWKDRDVFNYRKANRLTWHEKCDTKTMVLVRFEINLFFKHSGGCSECRVRDGGEFDGGGFDE